MQTPVTFIVAFVIVLALIGIVTWLIRRFASNRLGGNASRGRMPRLAVIDAAAVDGRRRLVLVRRDNVEHLLMIGGPTDIVVEQNIVRAPQRDQGTPRPSLGGELPPRPAPLPESFLDDGDSDTFAPEPSAPDFPARPSRPAFANEPRRAAAAPERRPSDPLAGFTPEPMTRPEPRLEPRQEARQEARQEPPPMRAPVREPMSREAMSREAMSREAMSREAISREPLLRGPLAARATPRPAEPAPRDTAMNSDARDSDARPSAPEPQATAEENLAEMAQRLEAALRRPAGQPEPAPASAPPADRPAPAASESMAPPSPVPSRGAFENLEDEMASLLGRPKTPS